MAITSEGPGGQPFVTAGKKKSAGLGLAISHQTVLDRGGELWAGAESTEGARFFVKLPLRERGRALTVQYNLRPFTSCGYSSHHG